MLSYGKNKLAGFLDVAKARTPSEQEIVMDVVKEICIYMVKLCPTFEIAIELLLNMAMK